MPTPDQAMMELALKSVALGDDIEIDIQRKNSVVGFLLSKAKAEAAHALIAMLNASPDDVATMRCLQAEALRFHEIAHWLRDAVNVAIEESQTIDRLSNEEIAELLNTPDQRVQSYEDD